MYVLVDCKISSICKLLTMKITSYLVVLHVLCTEHPRPLSERTEHHLQLAREWDIQLVDILPQNCCCLKHLLTCWNRFGWSISDTAFGPSMWDRLSSLYMKINQNPHVFAFSEVFLLRGFATLPQSFCVAYPNFRGSVHNQMPSPMLLMTRSSFTRFPSPSSHSWSDSDMG